MKPALFLLAALLLASGARAAEPELSTDAKRLLSYGTLAVMTQACEVKLTAAQAKELNAGLEKASQAQQQLSRDDFTEAMKAVGTQIGENKAQICSALTPDYIAGSLQDAAAGE